MTGQTSDSERLGVGCPGVTRRDFVGTTLKAAGAGALLSTLPGMAPTAHAQALGADWTGPGGIGDYSAANGNTAAVVNAAHRIRDGVHDVGVPASEETGEVYDLVVVGGGVAGLSAAYLFNEKYGGARRCLVLENHPMFGGESRGNQVEVDGTVVTGPQGANQSQTVLGNDAGRFQRAIGLPDSFTFAEAEGLARPLRICTDHYDVLHSRQKLFDRGWYLGAQHGWVRNPDWEDGFATVPWPAEQKRKLVEWFKYTKGHGPAGMSADTNSAHSVDLGLDPTEDSPLGRWLDTMSYHQYLRDVMRLDADAIARYIDPYLAITVGGSTDTVSAYAARLVSMPGVSPATWRRHPADSSYCFPMGNAIYPRLIVRSLLPKAYEDGSVRALMYGGRARLEELDRPESPTRIRLGSTVIRVEHEGSHEHTDRVSIVYDRGGRLYKVRARGVVMASGSWINRRIVKGMPENMQAAFHGFHHAPVLVANVAVRHWRFLEKLGISGARWFDGFGFTTCLRRPLRIDGEGEMLSPDKPTMLTFYAPLVRSGQPVQAQTVLARQSLFNTSFAQLEQQIRGQLQEMFGAYGFDAKRDIAGIILNRWGHAFLVPEPGFYYDRPGGPTPRTVVRKGFGRIAFGYSELTGHQSWFGAFNEARRAMQQVS